MKCKLNIFSILVIGFLFIPGLSSIAGVPPSSSSTELFGEVAITLYVTNVRQSVEFYCDKLGFNFDYYTIGNAKEVKELSKSDPEPYGAHLHVGKQRMIIMEGVKEDLPARGSHYFIEISDSAQYHKRLVSLRVPVGHFVTDMSDAPFMFSISDPDGHTFFFRGPLGKQSPK